MKTRVLKILGIALITVTLAVSFISIPVSAEGTYLSKTFRFPVLSPEYSYFRVTDTVAELDDGTWNDFAFAENIDVFEDRAVFYWDWSRANSYDEKGAISLYIGRSTFDVANYQKSDNITFDDFNMKIMLPAASTNVTAFRVSLRAMTEGGTITKRVASSPWQLIDADSTAANQTFDVTIPGRRINVVYPGDFYGLSVHLEFQVNSGLYVGLGLFDDDIVITYRQGYTPDMPLYDDPINMDGIQDNYYDEQQIRDEVSGTLEDLTTELDSNFSSSISNWRAGIKFATSCLTPGIDITWFTDVVQISLSLGIAASLLGIAASIIGASTRRHRGD